MVKWLNGCGEAGHLLFCNHYAPLLTLLNTQYSILNTEFQHPIIDIQFVVHPYLNMLRMQLY